MSVQIQLRRDAAADWTSSNPTLAEGEIGLEIDTNRIKIGDGATAWNSLTYFSGGAPSTADFLVGTANGSLSAEIVVGTTPGGELGNTWASPTVDASHSGSTHAATQAAAEATAAAGVATHAGLADPHTGYRLESADMTHQSAGLQGGTLDHGLALTGLTDDDHTQYLKETDVAAKGDVYVASANDVVGVLTAGADYSRLRTRAGATLGVEWGERAYAAVLASDFARTVNTSTMADVTGLTLALPALPALAIVWFDFEGFYQSNNTAMGVNVSMNAGGGTMHAIKRIESSATGPTYTENHVTALDGSGSPTTSVDSANTSRYFRIVGYIISPTGTLAARASNETATAAQGITIMAGSVLKVWMA